MKWLAAFILLCCPLVIAQTPDELIYGNAWQANALANLEIGKFAGRQLDIRFVAERTKNVSSVVLYMKTGVGYSAGTGGTVNVSLQSDDGTSNHFPSGTQLDSSSAAPGNPASPVFRTFLFSGTVGLVKGTYYHLVLTNTDGSPTTNYVSLDDLANNNNTAAPFYSSIPLLLNCSTNACFNTLAILWQNTAPPWALKTNHIPIFAVNYADGSSQGQGYDDAAAGSGLFTIQGTNQAGQLLNPTSDVTVGGVNVWVQKVGSPGALSISLQTAAGTVIETATIAAASIATSFAYASANFTSNHLLTGGSSYRVVLSSAADVSNNYQVFPMDSGACCGFNVPSLLSTGNYQTNTGSGWVNFNSSTQWAMPLFLNVADFYIAQTAQGGNTGKDCADAFAVSFFNTTANWGAGSNQIGAGRKVHLCGTITTELATHGSGTSGNPIMIIFEAGASIQITPGADANGILNLGSNSFITVDGGPNQPCGWNTATNVTEGACNGKIENMLYGSVGATCPGGTCTTQPANTGCPGNALIQGSGSNIEIRNLDVGPSYVHTATSNDTSGTPGICKNVGGTNWNIHDNKLHDGGWHTTIASGSTITITNNELFHNGHSVAGDCSANCSGITFSGNYCHDMQNWDTASDFWHNNCIHMYTNTSGQSMTNVTINNNIMGGSMGGNPTGQIFFETNGGSLTNFAVFNNVLANTDTGSTSNWRLLDLSNCTSNCWVYNNTEIGANTSTGWCNQISYSGGPALTITAMENNANATCSLLNDSQTNVAYGVLDYNAYGPFGQGWKWGNITINVFSTWKTSSGEGTHSLYNAGGLNLNASYQPNAGSPLIGAGVNVCVVAASFCTSYPAIKKDIAGNARPVSAAWDMGAYNGGAVVSTPSSPTNFVIASVR